MVMRICDLHTHVLPGVDDGAPSVEYALQMLHNAVASDVTTLAVTPHFNHPLFPDPDIKEAFLQLQQAAREIPITLVHGGEVRVNDRLAALLEAKNLPTINGSRYLLTEFAMDTPSRDFIPWLERILSFGYTPLVAHPERYNALEEDPDMVANWLDLGCHLQLTADSIQGAYGKKIQRTAKYLLQRDFVACVASDAHSLHGRSNFLMDTYDHLAVQYSRQYADCLMYETPMRICSNDKL